MADTNGTNGVHKANGVNGTSAPKSNGVVKQPVVDISVALSPNDINSVPDLVKSISVLSTADFDGNEQSRLDLVEKARLLVSALETPRETMIKHCWAQVSQS